MIRKQTLTIRDTNIMKGMSMLMIMFHNYFHQITPKTGENEFHFSAEYFQRLLGFLASEPLDAIRHLFSYFGHYGVQIFIVVSSYGLYISYKDRDIAWLRFMKKRILKLYPTLLIGIVFVILFYVITSSRFPSVFLVKESLIKLTLLYGFIPGSALSVSGPWWFFSAIVQLYAFFPLLKRIVKRFGPNSMLVTAFIFIGLTIAFNTFVHISNFSIYYTFVGQIPVFALGIYFAARSEVRIPLWAFLAALLVFAAANFYEAAYYFSFIAVSVLLLSVMIWIIPFIERFKKVSDFLVFTGSISLFLFVIHGALRPPFVNLAEAYPNPFLAIGLSIAFVALSYAVALWVRSIEKQVQEFIASGYSFKTLLRRVKDNDY